MKDWQRRIRSIVSTPGSELATGWHDIFQGKFIFASTAMICIIPDDGEKLEIARTHDGKDIPPNPKLANWEMILTSEALPNEGHDPDYYEVAPFALNLVDNIGRLLKENFTFQLFSGRDQGDLKPVIYSYGTIATIGVMKTGVKHERKSTAQLIG
jgi:hypothetical protein